MINPNLPERKFGFSSIISHNLLADLPGVEPELPESKPGVLTIILEIYNSSEWQGSNLRPLASKASHLPTDLTPR